MTESIRALVGQLSYDVEDGTGAMVIVSRKAILAAIEALKPMAEGTHVNCKEVTERLASALKAVLLDIDFLIEGGHLTDIRNDIIYFEARAALASINEVKL